MGRILSVSEYSTGVEMPIRNALAALLDEAPVLVLEVDEGGRIAHATGGAATRHGGPSALEGQPAADVFRDAPRWVQALEHPGRGPALAVTLDTVVYSVWVWPLGPTSGRRAVVLAVEMRDASPTVGEGQAQRLQSLGRLAGGIAHDFNNVLMAVMGHAQLIERRTQDEGIRAAAHTIVTATERAAGLTDQLLGFARKGKLRQEPTVVDDVVAEVRRLLARTVDRRIRVIHRPSLVPAVVRGDPGQLQQVILNLALNARDAMPDGGELVFQTDIVEAEPTDAEITTDLVVDTRVRLAVTDTGAGMTDDIRARVFEPYFTTKDVGEGHGLGLSMVYGIVRNHDGWIRVHSRPHEGSTFEVYLPLDRETLLDTPRPPTEPSTGRGHLLVVDDEAMVRKAIRGLLERLGYRVTEAEHCAAALELFLRNPSQFDAVMMDLSMPGIGGSACLRRMRQRVPDLRAVISSGYLPPETILRMRMDGPTEFLPKPYTIGRLADAVQAALRR